jgi:hypothetical protein
MFISSLRQGMTTETSGGEGAASPWGLAGVCSTVLTVAGKSLLASSLDAEEPRSHVCDFT